MTIDSESSTETTDTPSSLERELEERLRGARLILESIDLETLVRVTRVVATMARQNTAAARLARDYPAILAAYLVGEGMYNYKAGAFWPNLNVKNLRAAHDELGPGFLRALRKLRLDDFERLSEERALRYVAPILAHGGIPQYCLKDFFYGLLVPELQRSGAADASEILAIWRTRKTAFQGVDLPVRRFLLYGGESALDLLDRCVELVTETVRTGTVPSHQQAGLPRYIVKEFAKGPIQSARLGRGRSLPRPRIRLDPWDPLGPVMELPSLAREEEDAVWRVSDGQSVRKIPASASETRALRLNPARAWDVDLLQSDDKLLKSLAFECLEENPTVVFAPRSGQYVRDTQTLLLDDAWVLCPSDTELTAIGKDGAESPLVMREQLPEPVGTWQGFKLAHYDLRGLRAIRAERSGVASLMLDTGARAAILRVHPPGQRPELIGDVLADVTTDEGHPVFSRMPRLRIPEVNDVPDSAWRVQLRSGEFQLSATAGELGLNTDLAEVPDIPAAGVFHLSVRGPLGSDLRTAFAVIPGLQIDRPSEILVPGSASESAVVLVRVGSELSLEPAERTGRSLTTPVPHGADEVRCQVKHLSGATGLRIYVPRLLWSVARTTEVAAIFGSEPVRLGIEELEDGTATALVISTRRPDVSVAVALESQGRRLQMSDWTRTSSNQGRAVFDLSPFRDTARATGESKLDLVLHLLDRRIPLGHVFAKLVITNLHVESTTMHGWPVVHLAFDEPRSLRGRIARLWSLDRPWEDPHVAAIPDDIVGEAFVEGDVPAGRYRAEIDIDDPWSAPRRPKRGSPNTSVIVVGTPADARERLDRLDGGDPFNVLELAVRRGQIVRWLQPEELTKIAPAALATCLELLAESEDPDRFSASLSTVATILFRNVAAAQSAMAEAFTTGGADRPDLIRVLLVELSSLAGRLAGSPGEDMRSVWEACPPFAALADVVPALKGDPDALARCDAFLGWRPGAIPSIGQAPDQALLGMPGSQLREIAGLLDLVPREILGLDAFVVAGFEWLLAQKGYYELKQRAASSVLDDWEKLTEIRRMVAEGVVPARHSNVLDPDFPEAWWRRNKDLVTALPTQAEDTAARLRAREPKSGASDWGAFPQAVLACVVHVLSRTDQATRAAAALSEACLFAPRLVSRDLCLGIVLQAQEVTDA